MPPPRRRAACRTPTRDAGRAPGRHAARRGRARADRGDDRPLRRLDPARRQGPRSSRPRRSTASSKLERGAAPLRHLSAPLANAAPAAAIVGQPCQGTSPWTCSTPPSARARTPTRPIRASRSARRCAARTAASSPAATSRTSPIPRAPAPRPARSRRWSPPAHARSPRCWSSPTARRRSPPAAAAGRSSPSSRRRDVPVILAGLGGELARTTVGGAAARRLHARAPGAGRAMTDLRAVAARALACLDLTNLDEACDAAAIADALRPGAHPARAGRRGLRLAGLRRAGARRARRHAASASPPW